MTKSKYRDNRDWKNEYTKLYKKMVKCYLQPTILFETPKTYNEEGVAYKNNEIWYKFNIFTTKDVKNKTFHTKKIYIKDKKGAIDILYKYIILLKAIGSNKLNTYYCVYRMISDNFLLLNGIFDCNNENLDLISDKVYYIYNNDIKPDDSMVDKRNFCFKSDVINKKSKRTTIDNKKRGDKTFGKFCELYPKIDNKNILSYRLDVSEKQIGRLIDRYNKEMG